MRLRHRNNPFTDLVDVFQRAAVFRRVEAEPSAEAGAGKSGSEAAWRVDSAVFEEEKRVRRIQQELLMRGATPAAPAAQQLPTSASDGDALMVMGLSKSFTRGRKVRQDTCPPPPTHISFSPPFPSSPLRSHIIRTRYFKDTRSISLTPFLETDELAVMKNAPLSEHQYSLSSIDFLNQLKTQLPSLSQTHTHTYAHTRARGNGQLFIFSVV
jgi:hypothetical protein